MESLHLVYSPPISPFKINQQNKVQNGGPPMDVVYSVKSFSNRRFAGSTVRHQPRNKTLANKAAKWNVSKKSLPDNDSSAVIPNGSGLIRPSAVKRSSRKKSRKKGKQTKKASSCNVGSTEPEVISEDYGNGSSSSETCGNSDMDGRTMSTSTALEISLPDNKISEAPKTCTSASDDHNKASSYKDVYPTSFPDMHDSYVLDSISVSSISDGSTNAGHDEKNTEKEIYNIDVSNAPDLSSRKGYFSRRNSLNDVVDSFDHTKGTYSFRNSDQRFVVPNKRSKHNKLRQRSANVIKSGSAGNMRAGKENSCSIWQKVQKKDVDDCTTELKKAATIDSKSDIYLSENRKKPKDKVSKKLKRKPAPPTVKQEYKCYSRNGSYASMAGSDGSFKARMSLSDISDMSQAKDPKVGFRSSKVECTNSESVQRMQLCPNEMDHIESLCEIVSSMKNQSVGNKDGSMHVSCDSFRDLNLLQAQSPVYPPHLLCGAASQVVVPKQISLAESSRQNRSSYGSLTHKWMPVGLKDCELASSSRRDTSSSEHFDEAASKRWTVKSTVKGAAIQSRSQSRGDVCDSEDIEGMPPKSDTVKELTSNEANSLSSCDVSKRLDESEAYPSKIVEAINNACRAQMASEAVQMSTGHPIAEFERLLYHSSPIVHQSLSCTSCHTCCSSDQVNQVGGVSLCKHETPNITLGCLWEWYESYGSYGLEIMAEEVGNSPRLGADRFSFHAYFVPFLSGIQLFRNCGSTNYVDIDSRLYSDQLLRESSSIGSLSIFSLPSQPESIEDASELATSKLSSGSANDAPDQSSSYATGFSDLELLLEYFELEQPQMRRPLYDKIKELVSGDGHSRSKVYGDPTILHSINLNDIHPRSWYSVAWYPIYRIPDGNFRAAFLTYHSLGHLVHRSVSFESPSFGDCMVTPVVGLQSYNAQGECWFQLRPSELAEATLPPSLNSCEVMEERLRTLEETASLMARAVVKKGSLTCMNKHPDYEFFLSRRR